MVSYEEMKSQSIRNEVLFEDPDLKAVDSSAFFSRKPPKPMVWKRPKEICPDPKFFVGGGSRFDIDQGMLNDSWLVSAFTSLTMHEGLLQRVVPDQSFSGPDYVGIFRFNIWHQGKWEEIFVDDRLPTMNGKLVFVHSPRQSNEFWAPLLEKAFAKIHGSYEALTGVTLKESFENFTGGVAEMFDLRRPDPELFVIMSKCLDRSGLIGCSIESKPNEIDFKVKTGLIKGIAYSLTACREVTIPRTSQEVRLVRVRCPWGKEKGEWTGAWSDGSEEWRMLSAAEKKQMELSFDADGEFWMSFEDFLANFSSVALCTTGTLDITPMTSQPRFRCSSQLGSWEKSATAGGCRNFPNSFFINPQYRVTLSEAGRNGMCYVIIALMQKDRRSKKTLGLQLHTIGFAIYKLDDEAIKTERLDKDYFFYHHSDERSDVTNDKEVVGRFSLPPGTYCIIPYTFNPGEEGEFLLRIFTENNIKTTPMDETTGHTPMERRRQKPSDAMDAKLYQLFRKCAGPDGEIDPFELQMIINAATKAIMGMREFSLDTCRSLVAASDTIGSGKVDFEGFKGIWMDFHNYQGVFADYDKDNSGDMNAVELRDALFKLGFRVSSPCLSSLCKRFANKKGFVSLDDFVSCVVRMKALFESYMKWQKTGVRFTLDDYIKSTISL